MAELSLEKQLLKDVAEGNYEARAAPERSAAAMIEVARGAPHPPSTLGF